MAKRNPQAIKLLLSIYWKSGWIYDPEVPREQREFLTQAGYWPENPKHDHDACVKWALSQRDGVAQGDVAAAFLASLSTRFLEYRSALGSYAHLMHMPAHDFQRTPGLHSSLCLTCAYPPKATNPERFSVLNFERHKWGGVRHDNLAYQALDLQLFSALDAIEPTAEDADILRQIISAAEQSDTVGALKKSMGKFLKSNDGERDTLCHILCYCGVLKPAAHDTYLQRYVPYLDRDGGSVRSDQRYPLTCWRGGAVDRAAVDFWFPGLI